MRRLIVVAVAVAATGWMPALAAAAPGTHGPNHPATATHGHRATTKSTRAYGRMCAAESRRHVAGTKGSPFSQCVTALAHAATHPSMSASAACRSLSRRHVAGMRGTPHSQCVRAAAKLRRSARSAAARAAADRASALTPQLATVPAAARTSSASSSTACVLPDGSDISWYHCYTPQDIRSAYGVDRIAPLASGAPNLGQGQTIVLLDSYGSPTAGADLQRFHDTFFPSLPNPDFTETYPQGNPQGSTCTKSQGLSGPCAQASWTGEATLDAEWAYSIAPEAHIVMVAVPPAETEGVQGLPNLFKGISHEIAIQPAGTVFSMSFSASEQSFGGAGAAQTAKFDAVFRQGLAKHDNFFAASGDDGTVGTSKQHKQSGSYANPSVGFPASSPYVVSVGGTQLQDGWTWNPASNDAFTASGAFNPAYWQWNNGGDSQEVWNESWGPIASGGGTSRLFGRPSWQQGVDPGYGDHRIVPDTAWNAAVNGGVDVYISAYPQYNCGNTTGCWTIYGGTSAATPQTAALVALANAARGSAGKAPIGFLDPILYSGLGSSAYTDIVPTHEGSAPATFAGSDVGVSGTVQKSVGDLVDNQLWDSTVPGFPTTTGYDATTGWGTPQAPAFVADLLAMP